MAQRLQAISWRAICLGASGDSVTLLLALTVVLALNCPSGAAFNISLELQGDCSDQITLTCRHSETGMAPLWIHNDTLESGVLLDTAFPGVVYTVLTRTEHTATITGVDNVRALDGYLIQCVYNHLGNLNKSNAVEFTFIPPDYRPALYFKCSSDVLHHVSLTRNFFERNFTCTYSYQESCSLYPRCTPYFSVEHTVSPQSPVNTSSSGCSVEYTIYNLMRCVSYQSTATALFGSQRGNPIVVGVTIMLAPGRFTITSVSIGADRDLINVTYMENESDCPGYPTEWYTFDVDGVRVADLTAAVVQSLAINHTNGSVTLSLPLLNQPLPENAVTLNMTKYNTVPTNRSDDMGNIVTEMVTWGTSAEFALQESPPGGEPPTAVNDDSGAIGGGVSAVILVLLAVVGGGTAVGIYIKCRNKDKKVLSEGPHEQMLALNPAVEEVATPSSCVETPLEDREWVSTSSLLRSEEMKCHPYAQSEFGEEHTNPQSSSVRPDVDFAGVLVGPS